MTKWIVTIRSAVLRTYEVEAVSEVVAVGACAGAKPTSEEEEILESEATPVDPESADDALQEWIKGYYRPRTYPVCREDAAACIAWMAARGWWFTKMDDAELTKPALTKGESP